MWVVYVVLSTLIFLALFIKKKEYFISFDAYNKDVGDRLEKLKENSKRYVSKEQVLNDLLKILNCGNRYAFSVVNLSHTSDTGLYAMLYDNVNAFVCNINFDIKLDKSKKYYIIDTIEVAQSKMGDDTRFYNPEPIYAPV